MEESQQTPRLIITDDGSHSLFLPGLNETYHSRHGAKQESLHVFIEHGLKAHAAKEHLHILEVGFGTGLNAWLALQFALREKRKITFTTLETFPLAAEIYTALNYTTAEEAPLFLALHEAVWEKKVELNSYFTLEKKKITLQAFVNTDEYDIIFYDAFGPPVQPEMWTKETLNKVVDMMATNSLFVTYCAKGQVRRDLESCGLKMERLQGPPGKREMLRGRK